MSNQLSENDRLALHLANISLGYNSAKWGQELQKQNSKAGVRVYSALGLLGALSPTILAARENTEVELRTFFNPAFSGNDIAIRAAQLVAHLKTIKETETFALDSKSRTWILKDYPVKAEYSQALIEALYTELGALDFSDSAAAVEAINKWFGAEMVTPTTINGTTRMVSGNITSIDAKWVNPFTSDYRSAAFNGLEEVRAMYMDTKDIFALVETYLYQAVKLNLQGPGFVLAVLPKQGMDVMDVEEALNGYDIQNLCKQLSEAPLQTVEIAIPALFAEYEVDGVAALQAAGVKDPFSAGVADFSGMSNESGLYISQLQQKCSFMMDKKGIRQEAKSVSTLCRESCRMRDPEVKKIRFDRPYLLKTFVDGPTGEPVELFHATVYKPDVPKQ